MSIEIGFSTHGCERLVLRLWYITLSILSACLVASACVLLIKFVALSWGLTWNLCLVLDSVRNVSCLVSMTMSSSYNNLRTEMILVSWVAEEVLKLEGED